MFKKLRRIAFASMFVLDVRGPKVAFEDEEDEYEEETDGQDTGMDLDESCDGGVEEHETKGDEGAVVSDKEEALARNLAHLAVWADKFLDEYLRMLPPFGEIWFLDNRFAGNIAAGYKQMVTMGENGRAEHIISHYPSDRKRDGWWWNDNDRIPLD